MWTVPLVRHLAVVIAFKLLLLFLLWFLFFRQPDGAVPPAADIHEHIAGPQPAPQTHNPKEALR